MFKSLLEAKSSSLANIASACPNSADFLQLLNESVERIMRRGDFKGTTVPIYVCVKKGCIAFPKYVEYVRKAAVCNRYVPVRNNWYTFLDFNAGNPRGGWWGNPASLVATYPSPSFSDIYGDGRLLRFYPQAYADVGKTIKVFGIDNGNQPLRTINPDGSWSDYVTVILNSPFGSTSTYVRRVDRLILDDMTGPVTAFGYNVADDVLEEFGTYEPGDTNPSFTRYNLKSGCCAPASDCGESKPLIAMVKLRFVPARVDTDLVLIDNLQALKEMMQSIKSAEQGDYKSATTQEARAIRELNMDLRNMGDDVIPVSCEPFNGTSIGFQKVY